MFSRNIQVTAKHKTAVFPFSGKAAPNCGGTLRSSYSQSLGTIETATSEDIHLRTDLVQ
jgi:hypothetical protein